MKIGIHHRRGSFSDQWIEYCEKEGILYKIVNAYDSDIILQLSDCTAFLWHHHHNNYRDALFAKQLLISVQKMGLKVYPDFDANWHFDDKLSQKYLFEALKLPYIPTYVFYDKDKALEWVKTADFPKVFKLRGGAGSKNVKLIKNKWEASKKVRKAFGSGFSQFDSLDNFKERVRRYREGKDTIVGLLKGVARLFLPTEFSKLHGKEKGYVYFQDFILQNDHDIRVIVIGDKAFAIKRLVRRGDFRASGSGNIVYDRKEIDIEAVKLAFQISSELRGQSVAFDFVKQNGKLLLVEISYCYTANVYDLCSGYWDSNLNWFETKFNPQFWIIKNLLETKK